MDTKCPVVPVSAFANISILGLSFAQTVVDKDFV
jgi:hypothetical protein